MKLKDMERNSYYPYGNFDSKGTCDSPRQVQLR